MNNTPKWDSNHHLYSYFDATSSKYNYSVLDKTTKISTGNLIRPDSSYKIQDNISPLKTLKPKANSYSGNHEEVNMQDLLKKMEHYTQKKVNYEIHKDVYADDETNVAFHGCFLDNKEDGYGKSYYKGGSLYFEGIYKQGNRTGEGKLFAEDGTIKYKGDFLENKKTGYGYLYYPNGILQYKGKLIDGVYDGEGTYYYKNGQVMYCGKFTHGNREGYGKEYTESGVQQYEGEFLDNEYNGNGQIFHQNGHIFRKGIFKGNKMDGLGKQHTDDGKLQYAGHFKDNLFEGYGIKYNNKGSICFKGNFVEGKREGNGKCFSPDNGQLTYDGNFKDDKFDGLGVLNHANGEPMYMGDFRDGVRNGQGKEYSIDGKMGYSGDFVNNNFEGIGVLYDDQEIKIYEGGFKIGVKSGNGLSYNDEQLVHKGAYKNDLYNGYGEAYGPKAKEFIGYYKDGQKSNGKILHTDGRKAVYYQGALVNEQPDGKNVNLYYNNGRPKFKGEMIEGKINGEGKTFNYKGGVKKIGHFLDDEFVSGLSYWKNGKLKSRKVDKSYIKQNPQHLLWKNKLEKLKNENLFSNPYRCKGMGDGITNDIVSQKMMLKKSGKVVGKLTKKETMEMKYGKNKIFIEDFDKNGGFAYLGYKNNGAYSGFGIQWHSTPMPSVQFRGYFEQGKKEGRGVEFYPGNKLQCSGIYKNDHPEGDHISLYDMDGLIAFYGGLRNNKRHGFGIVYSENHTPQMVGTFLDGMLHGEKCEVNNPKNGNKIYRGGMHKGVKSGMGDFYNDSGKIEFSGNFSNDEPHTPYGKLYNIEGDLIYKGEITYGKKTGKGVMYFANQRIAYEGEFVQDQPHTLNDNSIGILYNDSGEITYKGGLNIGNKHGYGIEYNQKTKCQRYDGSWKDDKENDEYGTFYYENNPEKVIRYVGGVVAGKLEGFGELYYDSGQMVYAGNFR